MNIEFIESKVRKLIQPHYTRLDELKRSSIYKKIKPDYLRENYYLINLSIHNESFIKDWIVRELVLNPQDQLLIFDENVLKIFRDFKSNIYKDINKSLFEDINKRTFSYNQILSEKVDTENRYKVIVLGLLNARFKSPLFSNIGKNFPQTELILGFN